MIQHYFVSAWVNGDNDSSNVIYSGSAEKNTAAIIGIRTQNTVVKADSEKTLSAKLWVGARPDASGHRWLSGLSRDPQ